MHELAVSQNDSLDSVFLSFVFELCSEIHYYRFLIPVI